jgi:hypothetical protein
MDTNKLKMARESLVSKPSARAGSAGRESAEKSREMKRLRRKYMGVEGRVERVPNAKMIMPSKKRMMDEGMMDLINY